MDRLAVVPQGELREAFGIAGRLDAWLLFPVSAIPDPRWARLRPVGYGVAPFASRKVEARAGYGPYGTATTVQRAFFST